MDDKLEGGFGDLLKPAAFRGDLCFAPSDGRRVRFARVYRPQGWLSPVLLADGPGGRRVVARACGAGARLVVEIEPFARLSRAAKAGAEAEAEALARFLGGELELRLS